MPTVIPPIEKLPLAVRRNVRDEYESKRADYEEQITTLMGTAWKIDINPNAIWIYAEDNSYGKNSLGECLSSYVKDAIYSLKYFLEKHGVAGKDEVNAACPKHTLTLEFDESGKISYCGCDVHDGNLRILFQENNLGTNISYALQDLDKAISDVMVNPAISYLARHSIADEWEKGAADLQKKIGTQLANDKIILTPNSEAVWAALKNEKCVSDNRADWEKALGYMVMEYFKGLLWTLEYEKFASDDMLQEGFAEAVPKGEVKMRIVKKLVQGSYNECVIEDGVLYLQTTPENWGTNCSDIASKIVDIL
ncbi:hypothetical protein K432DRAFT_290480 [Lepidopterella palustris CBS 459.81]|uniref:Uncharacterized protein n=1 Tax=Lepidopterella palustris CBS 459.81 TaxID=1314670 RepID=A0A8E2EH53_9PEZI|nr:hypothetical protein K432DRAFT_290480 [Lepidopterella palustris CBS 459.81]